MDNYRRVSDTPTGMGMTGTQRGAAAAAVESRVLSLNIRERAALLRGPVHRCGGRRHFSYLRPRVPPTSLATKCSCS